MRLTAGSVSLTLHVVRLTMGTMSPTSVNDGPTKTIVSVTKAIVSVEIAIVRLTKAVVSVEIAIVRLTKAIVSVEIAIIRLTKAIVSVITRPWHGTPDRYMPPVRLPPELNKARRDPVPVANKANIGLAIATNVDSEPVSFYSIRVPNQRLKFTTGAGGEDLILNLKPQALDLIIQGEMSDRAPQQGRRSYYLRRRALYGRLSGGIK